MNGFTSWLVSLPTWAVATIVVLVLAAAVAAWFLIAARLMDRSEPGPQRGLVKAPEPAQPPWPSLYAAPLPADSLFTPFDSTDEFRAVQVPRVRHRAAGVVHYQSYAPAPWADAPPPRDGEAAGG